LGWRWRTNCVAWTTIPFGSRIRFSSSIAMIVNSPSQTGVDERLGRIPRIHEHEHEHIHRSILLHLERGGHLDRQGRSCLFSPSCHTSGRTETPRWLRCAPSAKRANVPRPMDDRKLCQSHPCMACVVCDEDLAF
jgi:hypothetical protein